jgi:hypothetical protein
MKTYKITLLAALFFALAACAVPGGEPTEAVDPTDPSEPTQAPPGFPDPIYSEEWLSGLPPETILLQMDYEPTFFREEAFHPFGRIPPFTLYADGTVVFLDEGETFDAQQLLTMHLEPEAVQALLRDVREAGFTGLEDQLDFCQTEENGDQVCIADASFTILRMTLPDGTLREVKTYANFSNDPGAFDEIVLIMDGFTHPDARPYMPELAVLFIRALPGDFEIPVQMWPLSEDRVPVIGESLSAIVLDAREVETFITAVGRNTGEFYFEVDGTAFSAYLVPWLPYADYTAEVAEEYPPVTPAPVEEPFMIIEETAVTNLAMALGIPEDEIVVTSFKEVTWSNGCLGINNLEIACTEALVPGYQLLLEAGGETYEYRSDRNGTIILPADETASPPIEDPEG